VGSRGGGGNADARRRGVDDAFERVDAFDDARDDERDDDERDDDDERARENVDHGTRGPENVDTARTVDITTDECAPPRSIVSWRRRRASASFHRS